MSSSTDPKITSRKRKSVMWDHFKRIPCEDKSLEKAECSYCGALIGCSSLQGTSSMHHHLDRCKEYPYAGIENRKKNASGQHAGVGSSSGPWKFDQDASRKELATMFILAELPFKLVEHEGFRRVVNRIQPKFSIPSRNTLRRDCYYLYVEKRSKLIKYFADICPRVCLTINTWTSCQNMSYMCLTAHFVDADWKLQKKIINFCQILGHSGEIIGKAIEECLIGWRIQSIFAITVDNASSNDLGIQYLKRRFKNSLVLRGELLHMRCCAHILSLIVRVGLKDIDDSVVRIRSAVRYVRSSPARSGRFKTCIERENIESKSLVCLVVETRWNSTYMMLESALKFEKEFFSLEIRDKKFVEQLSKGKGIPTSDDWEYARQVLPFLEEACERYNPDFDILTWWKVNSSRYPILSSIARDILVVPISTVASEAAFSTGGRVLDAFRSSLSPNMVEALLCGQDWLRATPLSFSIEEGLEELENFESESSNSTMEPNLVSLDD